MILHTSQSSTQRYTWHYVKPTLLLPFVVLLLWLYHQRGQPPLFSGWVFHTFELRFSHTHLQFLVGGKN